MTRTLFRFLINGQKFEAAGDTLIKRAPNKDFPTHCGECGKTQANAILAGVIIAEATRLNFVHFCPNDYVFIAEDERTFNRGTPTRCNRCGEVSPFPKAEARAIRENSKCWRVQTMAVLGCGHMDAHWIFETDLDPHGQPE